MPLPICLRIDQPRGRRMTNPYESPKVDSELQPDPAEPSRQGVGKGCIFALFLPITLLAAWGAGRDSLEEFSLGNWIGGLALSGVTIVILWPSTFFIFAAWKVVQSRKASQGRQASD